MRIKAEDYYVKRSVEYFGDYFFNILAHFIDCYNKIKCLIKDKSNKMTL